MSAAPSVSTGTKCVWAFMPSNIFTLRQGYLKASWASLARCREEDKAGGLCEQIRVQIQIHAGSQLVKNGGADHDACVCF